VDEAAGAIDCIEQRFLEAKVLEQRNYVGEGFMEGEDIRTCGFVEVLAKTVNHGVGGFMGNDVV
jgi:hypothetical protein